MSKNVTHNDLRVAEKAVVIATNVFNECDPEYLDSAIYELLGAEMKLKKMQEEFAKSRNR